MHTAVLLKEAVDGLSVKQGGLYIDATFGEGGHSREIVRRGGRVFAIDWDDDKFKVQSEKCKIDNLKLVWGNFADIEKIAKENEFYPVDGILFDLGLSMEQIAKSGRGFSYQRLDEPLDMRISKTTITTAANIINNFTVKELYEIFSRNSQEIYSWAIANAIVSARQVKKITTVGDLVLIINRGESTKRRIFQALRMAVNKELENLAKALEGSFHIVKPGGRVVVISFHQTEDRQVKNFIRQNKSAVTVKHPIRSKSGLGFEKTALIRICQVNMR